MHPRVTDQGGTSQEEIAAPAHNLVLSGAIGELVGELQAGWNAHDVDRVLACYAPTYEGMDIGEAVTRHTIIGLRKTLRRWFRAFPDLRLESHTLIVQGDQVAFGWLVTGTHDGTFMRIPPTRRPVTIRGVSLMTVEDGLITRASRLWDMAAFLRNVGLLPDLHGGPED